jgi:formate dehydrogenase subunit delta
MDIAKLHRMADQIAANFAANPHELAVEETTTHIRKFWDPRMKAGIFASDLGALSPIARESIERLMAEAKASA